MFNALEPFADETGMDVKVGMRFKFKFRSGSR